ncbi:hypothetical protein CsatB_000868 [Cannabis sativa]
MEQKVAAHVIGVLEDDLKMELDSSSIHYWNNIMMNNTTINSSENVIINHDVGNSSNMIYPNSLLSKRQMRSLTAVCDTLLPSIDASDRTTDDAVLKFYATSASMDQTPQHIGGLISQKLKHPKVWLLKVALWALSTWYGTLILCGTASLSSSFPYFQTFPNLSLRKRLQILESWSRSYFFLLRLLFKVLKILTLLVFFTQLDEKTSDNISWKAIGYTGPDSSTTTDHDQKQQSEEHSEDSEQHFGPLYSGIVNLNNPESISNLRIFGFPSQSRPRPATTTSLNNPFLTIKCDVVVVGSGSGGGVVAGALAMAGYKVLVLEQGNYYARKNLTLLEGPTMDNMYLSNGLMATDDMQVLLLAGSTVGGGSTINWSASIRTPEHVMKEWCDRCELELFGSQMYREALDVVCERMEVQSEFTEEGFNNSILRKGCQQLGHSVHNIPRNAPANHYCGWCCFGCKDGKKKGTSETWLKDLVDSGNGVILPSCEAVKVLHHRKKGRARSTAKGVAFHFQNKSGKKEMCIVESKVTVVACGALRTPTLLKKSGVKNPNIGKYLHLHPVVMAWGQFPDMDKKSYEGGIMTTMSSLEDKSGYGVVIQTPSLHPGMFSILMPWISGKDMKDRMQMFSKTAHVFALARDKGCGRVMSESSIGYEFEQEDEEKLQRGVEKILRIMAAAGAEKIGTHNREGRSINVRTSSNDELERFIKEESRRPINGLSSPVCSAHQMGSCRMGVRAEKSVVDQTGESWDVEGLFLADTSVFPTALGVNPMVTVQALAYCTAQSILQVLRRKKLTFN